MQEAEAIHIALENLERNAGIKGKWTAAGPKEMDGQVELKINGNTIKLITEIKKEVRNYQLPELFKMAERFNPLLIVANHIFPKVKEDLREKGVAYLETNGNIYLKQPDLLLWLDVQKPLPTKVEKVNRAFTKTGLKVIFHFLLNEEFLNMPYREIAQLTEVALGNINYVITGLKEQDFLIKLTKDQWKLHNKKGLLEKWMAAYAERLKPTLQVGTFRFLKEEDFGKWKSLPLKNGKTWWGGEPAGDIFTEYLKPAELTLYTIETRADLIKNYRMVPDDNGNIKVFKKFWHYDEVNDNVVPPLLAYTDLMNTADRRCMETAQKLYEQYLQNQF
ncbi:hypothetical protein HRH25_12770 [Flavisolibacter sp. BT320]|nr:hypothetical protein [Flavisolibacter longurius]